MTQRDFIEALQVSVTMPEKYKRMGAFVSVAQYPRGFEPDEDEFGMLVENDRIKERLFSGEEK